ncbi:hypothetical protein UFOVP105_45 [uncultured Caudovirales phage]|uniref:Uncharacterized protein n=1 Tax=uncultured Caudovirales phage TaxID=2100421 RepID=A0A6J5L9M5_9CAUD|nr:hypothetical protein UFOVP105_45 [uncultured Caudovirales phage]
MSQSNENNLEIQNFFTLTDERVKFFGQKNPDLQIFVTITIGGELTGGYQTLLSGKGLSLKERLRFLDGMKSELISNEVNKYSEFLTNEFLNK